TTESGPRPPISSAESCRRSHRCSTCSPPTTGSPSTSTQPRSRGAGASGARSGHGTAPVDVSAHQGPHDIVQDMLAIGANQYGGPEVLEVVDLPDPEPGEGELLVRVHAATVNPTDTYVRNGDRARAQSKQSPPPYVPGMGVT